MRTEFAQVASRHCLEEVVLNLVVESSLHPGVEHLLDARTARDVVREVDISAYPGEL